jgi:hypothetical protein
MMIDEEMNSSSYGDEQDRPNQEMKIDDDLPLGHFDEFGVFKYNAALDIDKHEKKKTTIDLKDLSERNFVDLLAAKN